jgi:hypothetical protein
MEAEVIQGEAATATSIEAAATATSTGIRKVRLAGPANTRRRRQRPLCRSAAWRCAARGCPAATLPTALTDPASGVCSDTPSAGAAEAAGAAATAARSYLEQPRPVEHERSTATAAASAH